jgi:hypothetical protein
MRTVLARGVVALCTGLFVRTATAETAATPPVSASIAPLADDRPHTVAEFNLGVLVLPGAPISPGSRGGDVVALGAIGKGDATLLLGLQAFVRPHRTWAFGAGARFGPSPTSDDQYGGQSGLSRTHSRSYFSLGVEARYIPLRAASLEGYFGLHAGGVIIADRFVTNDGPKVPSILGERAVTVATQGLSVGLSLGGQWHLTEHWTAGFGARPSLWFIPEAPACLPIGDCATLIGRIFAVEVSLSLGYRLPL